MFERISFFVAWGVQYTL